MSSSSLILSFTPGTFWPLSICQIFSLLHFKFFPNSLTHFLLTSWIWGPIFPHWSSLTRGEKPDSHCMCSAVTSQNSGWVHTCTVTWKMTPSSQDRSISCYPRLLNFFFQEGCTTLKLGSFSTFVEVRGLEKGSAASNFLGKPAWVPESSRTCSRAHWTLWEELSGLLGTMAEVLYLSTESQNHPETINSCRAKESLPDKLFQWKTSPWVGEVLSDPWKAPVCFCLFNSTSIEMQLQLKSTPLIKYVEKWELEWK